MKKRLLEQKILKIWYSNTENGVSTPQYFLYKLYIGLLLVPTVLYGFVVTIRRFLYKYAILKSFHPKVPVIIVGNISVGGTGKTQVVIALARLLQQNGLKPGVIIRGYARQSKNSNSILVTKDSEVYTVGDEAKLIFNRLQLPIAVGNSRVSSVDLLLAKTDCNIIISDDGMQHYKLNRDIEICVVDNIRKFGNNKLLPAGPLRENTKRLQKVDYILSKNMILNSQKESFAQSWINSYCPNNNSFNMDITPACFINVFSDASININDFKDYLIQSNNIKLYAMAGIGNNDGFFRMLNSLGIENLTTIDLSDHYVYKNIKDILNNIDSDKSYKKIILTTEKDAVKIVRLKYQLEQLPDVLDRLEIFYLKIDVIFNKGFINDLLLKIKKLHVNYKKTIKEDVKC